MIVAIVRFALPPDVAGPDAKALYEKSAPMYRGLPGLVRKYYLYEAGRGGGVYLWETREAAEAFYSADWRAMIADRYGAPPEIQFLECPVVVDNTGAQTAPSRAA